ncbi:hypothetical protein SAMN04515679_0935 [Pelosinus fermentans]|nr:hypothetical protein FR7_00880 [Pelosinus fermentans DSM 17108]SDQ59287.1 hypothetical protein SAMN04515679_0935 [Pelosinus fermentans]
MKYCLMKIQIEKTIISIAVNLDKKGIKNEW